MTTYRTNLLDGTVATYYDYCSLFPFVLTKLTFERTHLMQIPMSQISVNPTDNARVNLTGIEELGANIRKVGLLQPLVVRKNATGGYQLHAGFRRFEALKLQAFTEVEAVVLDEKTDPDVANMVENLYRKDLIPFEKAQGFAKLRDKGLTANKIADFFRIDSDTKATGTSVSNINNMVRLIKGLAQPILDAWKDQHPLATVPNLLELLHREGGGEVLPEDQLKAWEAMNDYSEDGEPEPNGPGESAGAPAPGPKRRSTAQIAKMCTLLDESDDVDPTARKVVFATLKWVQGGQKTLLGKSIDKKEATDA